MANSDEEDARRYRWLKANMSERLTENSLKGNPMFAEHKCEYVFPQLNSWADFCGEITLDEAIDIRTGHFDDED